MAKHNYGVFISAKSVKRWVDRWIKTNKLADRPRTNKAKLIISKAGMLALNKALLKNPCSTCKNLKEKINLLASVETIGRALRQMGWRHVLTKYCRITRPINRLKRFIFIRVYVNYSARIMMMRFL